MIISENICLVQLKTVHNKLMLLQRKANYNSIILIVISHVTNNNIFTCQTVYDKICKG